jgi:putative flippase GtrA
MLNDSNIDAYTRKIIKNSALEITDPEFTDKAMDKILRESRKRGFVLNLVFYLFVFVSVDALIAVALWLFGFNIFTFTSSSETVSHDMVAYMMQFINKSVLGNALTVYIFILSLLFTLVHILSENFYGTFKRKM